jgi:hypothetical protein
MPKKPKPTAWPASKPAPAGLGKGIDGRPNLTNTDTAKNSGGGGGSRDGSGNGLTPVEDLEGKLVVQRRHVDFIEHQIRWRWLLDSFEGGDRYRNSVYGPDRRGLPARNLFRHKREYPDPQMNPTSYQGFAGFVTSPTAETQNLGYGPYPGQLGADPAATAQDDDYEYRRSRTPVPEFVAEAVEYHLAKVYDQEVIRPGPDAGDDVGPPILRPPAGGLDLGPPSVQADRQKATAGPPKATATPAAQPAGGMLTPTTSALGMAAIVPVPQPIPAGPVNPEDKGPPGNPDDLIEWWKDVDGRGTPVDDWMRETIAPLLMVLGCLDIVLDHPKVPPGEKITTRADELRLGLDGCVASYILPQNMVWWRLDTAGRYLECLIREYIDPSDRDDRGKDGKVIDPEDPGNTGETWRRSFLRWRLWRPDESIVFSYDGDEVLERVPHSFGCVPIVRLIDCPKHRTSHIGKSRYEAIAEYQREYYNRDSELILSDTLQAHPFLSGAEDFCKADNTLSVGPGYILPMKKNAVNGTYQGWEFVSPPKDPAESLRRNKQDVVDMKDRRACLTKPAGATHGSQWQGSGTVGQSGISKQLDAVSGHKLLVSIAKSLAKAERQIAEYALVVLRNKPLDAATRKQISITYPARFELFAAAEMTENLVKLQQALSSAGEAPETEREILQMIVRQTLLGLSDADYERLDSEIDLMVRCKSRLREQETEMRLGYTSQAEAMQGSGSEEQAAGEDPTGESGGTMISNVIPSVM